MMDLPLPKDFSHHYSRVGQRTERSVVKRFYKYFTIPNIANIAGGLPDPKYFPFDNLEAKVALPNRFKPTANDCADDEARCTSRPDNRDCKTHSHGHITVPHDSAISDRTRKLDVAVALEYGTAQGFMPMSNWLRELARTKMHPNVPYHGGPEIIPTHGSTDGFSKALHLLTDIWDDRKDWIRDRQSVLYEEFTYIAPIQAAIPRGVNIVPVAVDHQGMMANGGGGLEDVLENWDRSKGRLPHVMYTIPVGQNPTSGTLSIDRKRQIYALCQKYDIMIIEDDPYWFLQYPSANDLSLKHRGKPISTQPREPARMRRGQSSGSPFLDSLVPSYLSLDVDGRVIRLDTFSKMVAPGCRFGWITAQPAIIEKLLACTDLMTMQPNGFVQSMVAELVIGQPKSSEADGATARDNSSHSKEDSWQMDGWIRWLEGLRGNYERRMQIMAQTLELGKYKISAQSHTSLQSSPTMPDDDFEMVSRTQMYDFNFPSGGMFLWLRMAFENHPLFGNPRTPVESLALAFFIFLTGPKYTVLVAPGSMFSATPKVLQESGNFHFRICFAAVADELLEKVSNNFVMGANDFFEIDDPKRIEDIIRSDEESSSLISAGGDGAHMPLSYGVAMY